MYEFGDYFTDFVPFSLRAAIVFFVFTNEFNGFIRSLSRYDFYDIGIRLTLSFLLLVISVSIMFNKRSLNFNKL